MRYLKKASNMILGFMKSESGEISVMFAVLLPVLLWCIFFFEQKMQARYIYTQTQAVFDFATKAGADTGKVYQVNGNKPICVIPYNEDDPNNSGYHVAVAMLKDNIGTIPEYAANSILKNLEDNKIFGLKDAELSQGGYVNMSTTFTYQPSILVWYNNYRLKIESTARCQTYTLPAN